MLYETPQTIEDAIGLLSETKNARVLGGGTDLLVQLRAEMIAPDVIVDIKRINGLRDVQRTGDGWRIGAAVAGAELGENAQFRAEYPGVLEGFELIGSTQIQGRATLAGNLCNASPAADSVPGLVAAGAEVEVVGPDGLRRVAVRDIPHGPGKTSLKPGEFITAILLPPRPQNASDAYLRFIPRTEMDIAVVGCAVNLVLDADGVIADAQVALGAVAPTVLLVGAAGDALRGSKLDQSALDALAAAATAAAQPIDDKRGTVAFRKHVAGVLATRTAKIAYSRAGGTA